jgi:hypothetical protein
MSVAQIGPTLQAKAIAAATSRERERPYIWQGQAVSHRQLPESQDDKGFH